MTDRQVKVVQKQILYWLWKPVKVLGDCDLRQGLRIACKFGQIYHEFACAFAFKIVWQHEFRLAGLAFRQLVTQVKHVLMVRRFKSVDEVSE